MYFAVGFRRTRNNTVLDVTFPYILNDESIFNHIQSFIHSPDAPLTEKQYNQLRDTAYPALPPFDTPSNDNYYQTDTIFMHVSDTTSKPRSTEDVYFRLHLLSSRLIKPHGINLDGIFGHLNNIVWTTMGPILPSDFSQEQTNAIKTQSSLVVTHIDKFPYMANYVVPSGVRIADASRVRLGAYLGEGTTVMPAGFVNFNAGTLGNAMVEGRISSGVVVGNDSDIGGGASIMGTLSGGNDVVISIGERCLLGANSGTGISLGNNCTIAAGVYVYAGKKVSLLSEKNTPVDIHGKSIEHGKNMVKAFDLSGKDNCLFIEDSQTGELICKPNGSIIQLNESLHVNV